VQPSQPISLAGESLDKSEFPTKAYGSTSDLNRELDDWFTKSATIFPAEEWLEVNDYSDALDDDKTQDWMSK
jgi:hypothetical protein